MKNEKKKGNSMLNNLLYQLRELWKQDKKLVMFYGLKIPVSVLRPLGYIYMPKVVIQAIKDSSEVSTIVFSITAIIAAITLLSILDAILDKHIQLHTMSMEHENLLKLSNKAMGIHYEILSRPDSTSQFYKVLEAYYGNQSNILSRYLEVLSTFIASIIGFVLYTGILSSVNLWILVIIVIGVVLKFLFSVHVNRWMIKYRDNWLKLDNKLAYLTRKASEYEAAKDIRLFHMKDWLYQVFTRFMKKRIHWTYTMQLKYYIENVIRHLTLYLAIGIAYWYLIRLVLQGDLSVANMVLYLGVITKFQDWCTEIIDSLKKLHEKHLCIGDVRNYYQLAGEKEDGEKLSLFSEIQPPYQLEFKNVSFCYPTETVPTISNLNLTIKPGEKIALVGVNGAGKTTFIKLLCGLYDPTEGTILINGKDRSLYDKGEYYTLFSTAFQESTFLPVSIGCNITNCEEGNSPRVEECLRQAGLWDKISSLPDGVNTLLEKSINEGAVNLSGGEQQKLMLARALYKDAPFLLLDEPTAALDPIAESEMYQTYNQLASSKTSFFISHRLASTRFCHRILLMEAGKVIEEGTHDTLMSSDTKYKEMFDVQSQYYKEKEECLYE